MFKSHTCKSTLLFTQWKSGILLKGNNEHDILEQMNMWGTAWFRQLSTLTQN